MSLSFRGLRLTSLDAAGGAYFLLGCLSAAGGLQAIANPSAYTELFGVTTTASPSSIIASRNVFIPVTGGSRVAGGLALFLCFFLKEDRAAAIYLLTGSIVAINDGIQLRKDADRLDITTSVKDDISTKKLEQARSHAWGHIFFGPVTALLGAWLYYAS